MCSPNLCRPAAAAVTALQASPDHLWIGTQSGVVVLIPFTSAPDPTAPPLSGSFPVDASTPIRSTAPSALMSSTPDPVIPSAIVNLSEASVSVYGHAEAVNFLTMVSAAVPGLEAQDGKVAREQQRLIRRSAIDSSEELIMFAGGVGFVTHHVPSQSNCKTSSAAAGSSKGTQRNEATTPPPKATSDSVGHLVAWSIPPRDQHQMAPGTSTQSSR
ncbi:unnamed protein product [Dibothriocephalus latus]|uniref:Uncharacterized protein n=1 Tax=Dibothriocephalus latus TaxID=60516 RepID=A0A3P7QJN8_DIBLA|nr:unnamed protein product [Dibothriocephalus latus]